MGASTCAKTSIAGAARSCSSMKRMRSRRRRIFSSAPPRLRATVIFAVITDWDGDPEDSADDDDCTGEEGSDVALAPGPGELGLGLSVVGTL